jgi:hypothetical protein
MPAQCRQIPKIDIALLRVRLAGRWQETRDAKIATTGDLHQAVAAALAGICPTLSSQTERSSALVGHAIVHVNHELTQRQA